ncbi:MAG: hypothetical protein MUF00_06765 [Gemmatimonadaceae bacterium]|jgi:hypothetical protein|nr:hypothetical protein [Gemmatimonadaceae bacterium]
MSAILLESVLFTVLIALVAAAVAVGLQEFTPLGLWLKQRRNRDRIDREVALTCGVHGPQRAHELVRLRDGSTMCPLCYQETVHGLIS